MGERHERSAEWRAFLLVCFSLFSLQSSRALEVPVFSPPAGNVTAPTLLSIGHSNPSGAIFYTTDGTDPRDAHGRACRTARIHPASIEPLSFGGPLSINRPMTVQARVKSGNEWSGLQVATFSVDQDFSQLLIIPRTAPARGVITSFYGNSPGIQHCSSPPTCLDLSV